MNKRPGLDCAECAGLVPGHWGRLRLTFVYFEDETYVQGPGDLEGHGYPAVYPDRRS